MYLIYLSRIKLSLHSKNIDICFFSYFFFADVLLKYTLFMKYTNVQLDNIITVKKKTLNL